MSLHLAADLLSLICHIREQEDMLSFPAYNMDNQTEMPLNSRLDIKAFKELYENRPCSREKAQ